MPVLLSFPFASLVVAELVSRIASAANHLHYIVAVHRHNGVVCGPLATCAVVVDHVA